MRQRLLWLLSIYGVPVHSVTQVRISAFQGSQQEDRIDDLHFPVCMHIPIGQILAGMCQQNLHFIDRPSQHVRKKEQAESLQPTGKAFVEPRSCQQYLVKNRTQHEQKSTHPGPLSACSLASHYLASSIRASQCS